MHRSLECKLHLKHILTVSCLRNLREQLPGILQLLPSVSQSFHFSVSFLENNYYFKKYCWLVCEIWRIMCVSGPHQCVSMVQGQGDHSAFCHGRVWAVILESGSAKDGCGVLIHFPWELRCGLSLPYPLKVGLRDECTKITGIDPGKIKSHLPQDLRLWPFLFCWFRLYW